MNPVITHDSQVPLLRFCFWRDKEWYVAGVEACRTQDAVGLAATLHLSARSRRGYLQAQSYLLDDLAVVLTKAGT